MLRPSLKTSIPYFKEGPSVHFRLAGTLISLDDDDGRISAFLELLDGTRSVEQIASEVRSRFPETTDDDIDQAIADLDADHLLQDATDQGTDFGADERSRWSNNLGFFETYASLNTSRYEFQRRIRDAKVAMLGVGGIGSHAFIDMVAIGFQDIRIVDFDHIELSNFNRQILYGEPFVGQPKVKVAAEKARALNSGIKLDTVQTRLTSADDVYEVVKDRDIVVAAVDRPKTEMLHWLNEGCVRAGTALVTGGVETQRAFYYTIVPGISGCAECWRAAAEAENPGARLIFDEFERQALSGEPFGEDTAAFNGLVILDSAFMVGELVRLSSRVSPPLSIGRVLEASFHDPRLREVESWKADPECPTCRGAQPKSAVEWTASIGTRPF